MPRCKTCKEKFEVKYFLQKWCMVHDECVKAFNESVKADNQKARDKKVKTEIKELKEKHKKKSDYEKELEKEINLIVRLIDKGQPCMMCSVHPMKKVNACHYHSVGSSPTLRFNLFNEWAGCESCNNHKGGNIIGYDVLLIEKQGRERWEYIKFDLTRLYKYIGLTMPEIKELTLQARKIAKRLKAANRIYSDSDRWDLRQDINNQLGIYNDNN